MAKKTNYLTELIERHERWKAEGGDKLDEEEQDNVQDLPPSGEEDLWDFGTVRHARPSTVGRNSNIQVSGPPLTWENGSNARAGGSSESSSSHKGGGGSRSSGSSCSSSVTAKGELPPLPPSLPPTPKRFDQQATLRGGVESAPSSGRPIEREPSDEDDYDDQYSDSDNYLEETEVLEKPIPTTQLDDDLPDTTMLDSVILPAIASLFPRVSTQEARVALSSLQRAFTEAERIIPGVTMELVNEIVDSVEHVEEQR